jgi:hypothetical protein
MKKIFSAFKIFNRKKKINDTNFKNLNSKEIEVIKRILPITLSDIDNIIFMISALKYIKFKKINGDIVECGTYKGGVAILVYEILKTLKLKKKILLFDTFNGMARPTRYDRKSKYPNLSLIKKWENLKTDDNIGSNWVNSSLDEVKNNIKTLLKIKTLKNFSFFKGKVEDTLKFKIKNKISILRIDLDLYSPTKTCLEKLYTNVEKGGLIIFDDYESFLGQKKAVDNFFSKINIPITFGKKSAFVIK